MPGALLSVLKFWAQVIVLSHLPLARIPYASTHSLCKARPHVTSPGWPPSGYVVEDDLEFLISLSPPLEGWVTGTPSNILGGQTQGSVYRKLSTNGAMFPAPVKSEAGF